MTATLSKTRRLQVRIDEETEARLEELRHGLVGPTGVPPTISELIRHCVAVRHREWIRDRSGSLPEAGEEAS